MDPDEAAEAAGPTGLLAHPDPFALKGYRCNAPPVEAPYDDPDDNQKSLNDAFAPVEGWRIDGSTERRPAAFEAIKASLEAEGAESIYATAVDPETGVRPTHACAVNGYASLLKLLVEVGGCDPLAQVSFACRCSGLPPPPAAPRSPCPRPLGPPDRAGHSGAPGRPLDRQAARPQESG